MLAVVASAALRGIEAEPVQVEVNANEVGDPRLVLVGLPGAAVKESDDRVLSALANSGFEPLRTRTTINLAPGHLRKEGPLYDLPIALGILASTGQLGAPRLGDFLIAGELGLSGRTRPVRGGLAMARLAQRTGKAGLLLPPGSAEEAALLEGPPVRRVESLAQAIAFLAGREPLPALRPATPEPPSAPAVDFAEVKGQRTLRRAIEVACAGGHNLLVVGPPGSGKSMAARRVPTLLPPPTRAEQLDILAIHSAAGRTAGDAPAWGARPFRAPHHTASDKALLGGGGTPAAGEITLAHRGVLFLDELTEFRRSTLEVLRQPLEDGEILISRNSYKYLWPSDFLLIAACNPCPCGHHGSDARPGCRCTPAQIQRYRAKLSGPLLDRIDLHVETPALTFAELRSEEPGEPSAPIRERVARARELQIGRLAGLKNPVNAQMGPAHLRRHCRIGADLAGLLQQAMERLSLSARAHDRILKVARTIADLAGAEAIEAPHLLEAIQYRALDRQIL